MPTSKTTRDYYWVTTDEPHASRRKEILQKYPQIKELFGCDPKQAYTALFFIITQAILAVYLHNKPWWILLAVAYSYGGVAGHALYLAMHELSHNLFFPKSWQNKLFGIFTNLFTIFPHFSMFEIYHREHHQFQGTWGIDTDVPSRFETKIFTNPLMKILWLLIQPAFYVTRPLLAVPKVPRPVDLFNWVCCIAFSFGMYQYFGIKAVVYLFLSGFFGGGLHPVSGHFIAEHYVFVPGQETYSYYGPLNKVAFNVGYHNEHHDFPRIPGSRLPKVKEIAPEYYDMPHYNSWMMVLWNYITNPEIGPWSRIVRENKRKSEKSKNE